MAAFLHAQTPTHSRHQFQCAPCRSGSKGSRRKGRVRDNQRETTSTAETRTEQAQVWVNISTGDSTDTEAGAGESRSGAANEHGELADVLLARLRQSVARRVQFVWLTLGMVCACCRVFHDQPGICVLIGLCHSPANPAIVAICRPLSTRQQHQVPPPISGILL